MKKIKKIAASLMALAVTAASMSSIPADATSYYKDKCFEVFGAPAHGYVLYEPDSHYKAVTRCASDSVYDRNVVANAYDSNGLFRTRTGYSYDYDAVCNIYCATHITSYQTAHWAFRYGTSGTTRMVLNF